MVSNNFNGEQKIIQIVNITNNYYTQSAITEKKSPEKKFEFWKKVVFGLLGFIKLAWPIALLIFPKQLK